jgi:16S rRNA (cytidine1402-2'-O)-methyltransferase
MNKPTAPSLAPVPPAGANSPRQGQLVLVPNTLDLGSEAVPLQSVLPMGVVQRAASLLHWVVEDARSARAFLKRVNSLVPLAVPLQALDIRELPRARKGSGQAVDRAQWAALLTPLRQGADVALLSEAGLPAVADPGAELVAVAHASGFAVQVLAGPSSLLMALAASGLNGQSFTFLGYLPQDSTARTIRIKDTEAVSRRWRQTQICIETPYRNASLLAALLETLGPDTRLSVSWGLTLDGARTLTDSVARWRSQLAEQRLPTAEKVPAVFSWLAV